jgi:hypothetical protein
MVIRFQLILVEIEGRSLNKEYLFSRPVLAIVILPDSASLLRNESEQAMAYAYLIGNFLAL